MSSAEETMVTMVALLEDSYCIEDLQQVRLETIKRRSIYLQPACIDYIARNRLKRVFCFELGTAGELRRNACQILRDVQNIIGFMLSIHQGSASWLYYTLTA